MIGIPTSFTRSIVEQVVTGFVRRDDAHAPQPEGAQGGRRQGQDARPQEAGWAPTCWTSTSTRCSGRPASRASPRCNFGVQPVGLVLPVHLAEGTGRRGPALRVGQQGPGSANVVCGDIDITRAGQRWRRCRAGLQGGGRFGIASKRERDRADAASSPTWPCRIFVDPSEQAWAVVDEVVKAQRKGCEIALNKVDIKAKLGQISSAAGSTSRSRRRSSSPSSCPPASSQSLEVQGIHAGART